MVSQARRDAPDTLRAMAARHVQLDARGLRFEALAAGPRSGELVLLLHGFPQSAECWRDALNGLSGAGYRVVAPNQRGYSPGARPEDVAEYRVSELVADVLAMADVLGHRRFHVAGHDWGGVVAWALAAGHQDRVASLTAVSTPHPAALAEALRGGQQRARMAYIPVLRAPMIGETLFGAGGGVLAETALAATGLERATARRDVRHLLEVGPTGALNWYRAIGRTTGQQLARVDVPTLFIWGDRDVAFGREAAELTEEHVGAAYHLVELDGASHWIPDQHWGDVADLVLEHLAENPAGGARSLR